MAFFSSEQIRSLAPDAATFTAACKISKDDWISSGRSSRAFWGEYPVKYWRSPSVRVQIDLETQGYYCSRPACKKLCKHILGLMLLESESRIQESEPPEWVENWLAERTEQKAKKQAEKKTKAKKPVSAAEVEKKKVASQKTTDKRAESVAQGLDDLKTFLCDLFRAGLVNLEGTGGTCMLFEERSKRFIDARAPGVAAMVAKLKYLIYSGDENWRERLAGKLGSLALLIEAYSKIDETPEDFAYEIRQTIGWTIPQKEVLTSGERIEDRWFYLGGASLSGNRFDTRTVWVLGENTGRYAYICDFKPVRQDSFSLPISSVEPMEGALRFYPGTSKLRALWESAP